jgi:hypothetical protein
MNVTNRRVPTRTQGDVAGSAGDRDRGPRSSLNHEYRARGGIGARRCAVVP